MIEFAIKVLLFPLLGLVLIATGIGAILWWRKTKANGE